jgi:hypothetical protein
MKQSVAAFLSLQTVFQFSRFGKRQVVALPYQCPRSFSTGPFGDAGIVLSDAAVDIVGESNVKFSLTVLNEINAINHRGGKDWLRGLDLNQRPSGYEPDELPDCSTPRDENTWDISLCKSKTVQLR